jgi:hypothetical protein
MITKCTDVGKIAKGLFPGGEISDFSSTIIPLGMNGSVKGKLSNLSECKFKYGQKIKNYKFSTWQSADSRLIEDSFSKLFSAAGIKIEVEKRSYVDLSNMINSGNFDLLAISIDTTNLGYKNIFTSLFDLKDGLLKKAVPLFADKLSRFKNANSLSDEEKIARNLQTAVLNQYWALPIGPTKKTLRLASDFSQIEYGDDFLLFPKISKIRAKLLAYVE